MPHGKLQNSSFSRSDKEDLHLHSISLKKLIKDSRFSCGNTLRLCWWLILPFITFNLTTAGRITAVTQGIPGFAHHHIWA